MQANNKNPEDGSGYYFPAVATNKLTVAGPDGGQMYTATCACSPCIQYLHLGSQAVQTSFEFRCARKSRQLVGENRDRGKANSRPFGQSFCLSQHPIKAQRSWYVGPRPLWPPPAPEQRVSPLCMPLGCTWVARFRIFRSFIRLFILCNDESPIQEMLMPYRHPPKVLIAWSLSPAGRTPTA